MANDETRNDRADEPKDPPGPHDPIPADQVPSDDLQDVLYDWLADVNVQANLDAEDAEDNDAHR